MLVIPTPYYHLLIEQCATLSPEYLALKYSIRVRDVTGDRVRILCGPERVKLIMDFAEQSCADATQHIQRIPDWCI